MRFARLARKFEGLQFGHRFLSNWMNCLGVIVQSVLKDFYLEDSRPSIKGTPAHFFFLLQIIKVSDSQPIVLSFQTVGIISKMFRLVCLFFFSFLQVIRLR